MNQDIYVSVICNAYNQEKYIEDALKSFVNQKTQYKYEVFVHDDASTDKTGLIIKKYAEQYPDIIKPILEKENQYSQFKKNGKGGISKDIVFPKCNGKYICFCEGDDYWLSDQVIEKKVSFLENNIDYVACLTRTKFYDAKLNKFFGFSNSSEIEYDYKFIDALYFLSHTTGWMIRKEIFTSDKYPINSPANKFGDSYFGFYTTLCGKVRYFPEVMSVWRKNIEGSWTIRHSKESVESKMNFYLMKINFYKYLKDVCPNEYKRNLKYIFLSYKIKYNELRKCKFLVLYNKVLRKLNKSEYNLRRD